MSILKENDAWPQGFWWAQGTGGAGHAEVAVPTESDEQ